MITMRKTELIVCSLAALLLLIPTALAEDAAGVGIEGSASKVQQDLESSMAELGRLRKQIAEEKLPLTRRLGKLETELIDVRERFRETGRDLDTQNLELTNLRTEISARHEEKIYLSDLLDEYLRSFETRIHLTEKQRYDESIEAARLAPESSEMSPKQVFEIQAGLVELSLDRLFEVLGGTKFPGEAVSEDGRVHEVDFVLVGPLAMYRAQDGSSAGVAEELLGSLEPNMIEMQLPEQTEQISRIVSSGTGEMPFDPTLGDARSIEATKDSWRDQIEKGGPLMYAILALAFFAFSVAVLKGIQIARVRRPSERGVKALLESVKKGDIVAAKKTAAKLKGPTGEMLQAGVEQIDEPKELVEEVMFERMLETRLRLQSYLPFIAVAAAASPLLGLLGTVNGIIETFRLMTVFGTGDAKTLSSGISVALITTKFGLIVAIPSLLLHAFLSRRARRLVDDMEKTAVSLLNRISPTETAQLAESATSGSGASLDDLVAPASKPTAAPAGLSPVSLTPRDALDH